MFVTQDRCAGRQRERPVAARGGGSARAQAPGARLRRAHGPPPEACFGVAVLRLIRVAAAAGCPPAAGRGASLLNPIRRLSHFLKLNIRHNPHYSPQFISFVEQHKYIYMYVFIFNI